MEGFAILDEVTAGDVAVAAAGGFALTYGVVLVSGYLPLSDAAIKAPAAMGKALVVVATGTLALLAALLAGYILFGTSWAPALIAAGLAVLAAPPVFQALPVRWTGGAVGLALTVIAGMTMVVILAERLFT